MSPWSRGSWLLSPWRSMLGICPRRLATLPHWHFWRNRLFLLTKNALLKRGPKNSGMGRPHCPPHSGNARKKTFFFIDVFPYNPFNKIYLICMRQLSRKWAVAKVAVQSRLFFLSYQHIFVSSRLAPRFFEGIRKYFPPFDNLSLTFLALKSDLRMTKSLCNVQILLDWSFVHLMRISFKKWKSVKTFNYSYK